MIDKKELVMKAKREALGWIELTDDPVPVTIKGVERCGLRIVQGAMLILAGLAFMKALTILVGFGG